MDYVFWGVVGAAFTTAFMMHFWLPDPPPLARWLTIVGASFIGGALGGGLGRLTVAANDPMPARGHAVLGALALGLLAGAAAVVMGGKRTAGMGR